MSMLSAVQNQMQVRPQAETDFGPPRTVARTFINYKAGFAFKSNVAALCG